MRCVDFCKLCALSLAVLVSTTVAGALPVGPSPNTMVPIHPEVPSSIAPATQQAIENLSRVSGGQFSENVGQLPDGWIRYYSPLGSTHLMLGPGGVVISLLEASPPNRFESSHPAFSLRPPEERIHGVSVKLSFLNANDVAPQGVGILPYRSHFFLGSNPNEWKTHVRNFRAVTYSNLYDGVDVTFLPGADGPKYEFLVHPGADISRIHMRWQGLDGIELVDGSLVIRTAVGDIRDAPPVGLQDEAEIPCRFVLEGVADVRIACSSWSTLKPLLIDPGLYITYLGGGQSEAATSIRSDSSGSAYVAGIAMGYFPTTPGAFQESPGAPGDAFVLKLTPDGSSLVYSTYIGGNGYDSGYSLAIDAGGIAYLCGGTGSSDFPMQDAYDSAYNGLNDGFYAKLSADGSALLQSTYLGGSASEWALSIAIEASGTFVLAGETHSTDFPVTPGSIQTILRGAPDGFVTRFSADGLGLIYSTYLGGTFPDVVRAVVFDAMQYAYVTGPTYSADFPVTPGAYDTTCDEIDAFVAKITPDGASFAYSTFVGGGALDWGIAITLGPSGRATITGYTQSSDYPTTPGAFDQAYNGGDTDAFATQLDSNGASLTFSTFLGGSGWDFGWSLEFDTAGSLFIAGDTVSLDFPTTGDAYDSTFNGIDPVSELGDGWVVQLDSLGSILMYSSYFGGSLGDWPRSISKQGHGCGSMFYIAGQTTSPDFPTSPSSYDPSYNGETDAFVAAIPVGLPGQPRNLISVPDKTYVTLSWNPPLLPGCYPVTDYEIFRGTSSSSLTYLDHTGTGTFTTYQDNLVTQGVTYYYRVRAVNLIGAGGLSEQAHAMPSRLLLEAEAVWVHVSYDIVHDVFAGDVDGDGTVEILTVGEAYIGPPMRREGQLRIWNWDGVDDLTLETDYLWAPLTGEAVFNGVYAVGTTIFVVGWAGSASSPNILLCEYTWDNLVIGGVGCFSKAGPPGVLYSAFIANVAGDPALEFIAAGTEFFPTPQGYLVFGTFIPSDFVVSDETTWSIGYETQAYDVYAKNIDLDAYVEMMTVGSRKMPGTPVLQAQVRVWEWDPAFRFRFAENLWNDATGGSAEALSITASDTNLNGATEVIVCGYTHDIPTNSDWAYLKVYEPFPSSVQTRWRDLRGNRCDAVYAESVDADPQKEIITGGFSLLDGGTYAEVRYWTYLSGPPTEETRRQWNDLLGLVSTDVRVNGVFAADVDIDSTVEILTGGQGMYSSPFWEAQLRIWRDP